MPFTYEIDRSHSRVVSRWWNVTGDEELIEYYQCLRRDPAFRPWYRELVDIRGVARIITASVTIQSVARLRLFDQGVRRAAIAGTDATYGIARMFAAYAEAQGYDIEVFRSEPEALAWLDREDSPQLCLVP